MVPKLAANTAHRTHPWSLQADDMAGGVPDIRAVAVRRFAVHAIAALSMVAGFTLAVGAVASYPWLPRGIEHFIAVVTAKLVVTDGRRWCCWLRFCWYGIEVTNGGN